MKILIVDDSPKWVMWHESAVKEILGNNADIDKAFSASQGVEKLTASIDLPYDIIFTDMQMEPDFLPLYAGEWFIKQIKFFNEYKNSKVIVISADLGGFVFADKKKKFFIFFFFFYLI